MRHELAHVYAIRRSKGRVPRWFTEGLSEWESEQADPAWARESAALLTAAKKQGKLRKLSELELAFIRAESPLMMEAAYATSAYAIRYLAATYGRDKLIAILDGYGEGKHTDALFAKHFGKPLATVERDFETWFTAQLAAKMSGWSPGDGKADDERNKLWIAAQTQVQEKDNAGAIRTLESLAAKNGDGFATRMAIAELVMEGKSPAAAKRHLEAAMKFSKESIEPHVRLAKLAKDAGEIGEEKKVLRAALAIDADSLDPAARFLMLALVSDDADGIALGQARVAALAPLHPIALAARAIALAKGGKAADAKAHVARANEALASAQGRGPADTLVVVALAHRAIGDEKGADVLVKQLGKADIPAAARKKLAL
jgi:predicted Zn-dependent protease